ncbi:MAG: hypothetical protein JWM12_1411 [Ilumatobacteraceae bacterium]|nr:hypothetical protein [Ilumatobacteraceae bacterium]
MGFLAVLVASVVSVAPIAPIRAAGEPTPPFIPAAADWLTSVNYYRAMSGLPAVSEDPSLSVGAQQHSCYMLQNGISHDEVPGNPGYTVAGDSAGNNGNVAVSSAINASARGFVELWMTGPYHAVGVLRPGLHTVGFGRCDRADTPTWHAGATLDVLHGLGSAPALTQPILFPGNGTTTSLNRFVVESPNPLDACGWTGSAGLPVLAMMPESTAGATATISGPSGPIETCVVSGANTTGTAKAILDGDNVVVAIPRVPLADGTHHISMHTNARTVEWSFGIDQAASDATPTTPADAAPTGTRSTMQPLLPSRIVDTRIGRGALPFQAGSQQRIQVTGTGGVPAGATAVMANVTATEGSADGFVTLWNCAGARPNASTLNFRANRNVPNSATIPLDSAGGICAFAYAGTQLIVDVTGYTATDAADAYDPVIPTRVMDTRSGLGPSTRLAAGQTVELQITGTAGVPVNAAAAVLNVTADDAAALGVVTVFPCGSRPEVSNLNPAIGQTRANLVITALSGRGTVCLFSQQSTDLIVDVFGYFAGSGSRLTVTTPFRFTDTRERTTALNAGLGGAKLRAGQVVEIQMAGVRGIAGDASAISANITATDANGPGWLAAWPCAGDTPTVSNVNYGSTDPVANAAQLTLSGRGSICVVSYTDVHVIIDVNGWWS